MKILQTVWDTGRQGIRLRSDDPAGDSEAAQNLAQLHFADREKGFREAQKAV